MPLSYFKTDLSAKSADLLAGTSMLLSLFNLS